MVIDEVMPVEDLKVLPKLDFFNTARNLDTSKYPNLIQFAADQKNNAEGVIKFNGKDVDWNALSAELETYEREVGSLSLDDDYILFVQNLYKKVVETQEGPADSPNVVLDQNIQNVVGAIRTPVAVPPAREVGFVSKFNELNCPGVSRCIDSASGKCIYRQCCGQPRASLNRGWTQAREMEQLRAILTKFPGWTRSVVAQQMSVYENMEEIKSLGGKICWRHTSRNNVRWEVLKKLLDKSENVIPVDPSTIRVRVEPLTPDQKTQVLDAQVLTRRINDLSTRMGELEREHLSNMHELSDINNRDVITVDLQSVLIQELGGLFELERRMGVVIENSRTAVASLE